MVMKFHMNVSLQYSGFKGEGIVDDRIWINKSHFPFRMTYDHPYKTQLVLCCVRNPLDVFNSFFQQVGTLTHNNTIAGDYSKLPEWELLCKVAPAAWRKWHEYWLKIQESY